MKQSSVEGSTMQSTIEGITTQSDAGNRNVIFYSGKYDVDPYIIKQIIKYDKENMLLQCISQILK